MDLEFLVKKSKEGDHDAYRLVIRETAPSVRAYLSSRCTTATAHVDQASKLGYVHLQVSSSTEDTLKGKEAFENYARQHGIPKVLS